MASLRLQSRSDITDLKSNPKHHEITAKFVKLKEQVDDPSLSGHTAEASWNPPSGKLNLNLDRRILVNEFNNTLEAIRSFDGFSRVFKELSLEAMMKMAEDTGPIVALNIANHRSDAFLVRKGNIRNLRLEGLSAAGVREKSSLCRTF